MKISFPSRSRPPEDALIREARLKAESTDAHWALNHLPQIVDSITLTYDESTVQGRLKSHLKEKYEERVMRVASLGKPHPLSELEDPRDFAQVFYDILQIHQWLYECAGILHHDLSIWQHHDIDKDPSSNHRTSTRPFMSTELLNPAWKGGHYYRHDLESLFYTMLCIACRYERPGAPAAEPRAYPKRSPPAKIPIQPYFAGFESWLKSIYRSTRFGYLDSSKYSPEPDLVDQDSDFDWTTLNKCVCYATIRLTMSSFEGNHLETRWAGCNPDH
ncbi:hypothetical protein DFH05DRAFT_1528138 [Lentinula detonsa]|uniref:Fungal-type protein kinase domain-containing protein n=1 Tax=Lentinula detonsa TaxID=2804962 RepID=A0A9W8NUR6_9AGAR|nr:hypothetical protein DFH05DRAFT_1528138 [Lentinula detonsa]